MVQAGIEVYVFKPAKGGRNAAMHSKTLLIRGACVIVGSANFTHNSHDCCIEDCLLSRSAVSVQLRESRFDEMWAQAARVDTSRLKPGTSHSKKKIEAFLEAYGSEDAELAKAGVTPTPQATLSHAMASPPDLCGQGSVPGSQQSGNAAPAVRSKGSHDS